MLCTFSYLCLKTLTEDFVNFLSSISSVCLSSSCAYATCTMCLSSFHHDDHACILLCLLLSTYSAASSSSLRNFLTRKFLSEEFIKIAYSPPSSRSNTLSTIIVGRGVSPSSVHRSCAPCSILRVLVDVASVPSSCFALDLMAGWVGMLLFLGCCFVWTEPWPARHIFRWWCGLQRPAIVLREPPTLWVAFVWATKAVFFGGQDLGPSIIE